MSSSSAASRREPRRSARGLRRCRAPAFRSAGHRRTRCRAPLRPPRREMRVEQLAEHLGGQQRPRRRTGRDVLCAALECGPSRPHGVTRAARHLLHRNLVALEVAARLRRCDDDDRVGADASAAWSTQSTIRRPSTGCRCFGTADRIRVPRPAAMTTAAIGMSLTWAGSMAGAPGFEPGIAGPKPAALPLGYAPLATEYRRGPGPPRAPRACRARRRAGRAPRSQRSRSPRTRAT